MEYYRSVVVWVNVFFHIYIYFGAPYLEYNKWEHLICSARTIANSSRLAIAALVPQNLHLVGEPGFAVHDLVTIKSIGWVVGPTPAGVVSQRCGAVGVKRPA